jgi:hypothetical protein
MTIQITDTPYSKDYKIINSSLTVDELEELTTYGGSEEDRRSFTNDQINELSNDIEEAIQEIISNFLNVNS